MHGNPSSGEHAETIETVRSIPRAMRNMGWTTSAELMERWLRSSAWVLPPEMKTHENGQIYTPANSDQRIVRMAWAMMHPRFKVKLDELRGKVANLPAKSLLQQRLLAPQWPTSSRFAFGRLQNTAVELENSCQSNSLVFGKKIEHLDDMHGSIGVGTLKVALIGEATRKVGTRGIFLNVTHAGFYIRDNYDFNGFQYLGAWTKNRILTGAQTGMNFPRRDMAHRGAPVQARHVFNRDFETYRKVTGYGGDYVIYSDVLWERMNLKLEFLG
jgi:hypothetical protein